MKVALDHYSNYYSLYCYFLTKLFAELKGNHNVLLSTLFTFIDTFLSNLFLHFIYSRLFGTRVILFFFHLWTTSFTGLILYLTDAFLTRMGHFNHPTFASIWTMDIQTNKPTYVYLRNSSLDSQKAFSQVLDLLIISLMQFWFLQNYFSYIWMPPHFCNLFYSFVGMTFFGQPARI